MSSSIFLTGAVPGPTCPMSARTCGGNIDVYKGIEGNSARTNSMFSRLMRSAVV